MRRIAGYYDFNLYEWLKANGLTQGDLAKHLDTTPQRISRIATQAKCTREFMLALGMVEAHLVKHRAVLKPVAAVVSPWGETL